MNTVASSGKPSPTAATSPTQGSRGRRLPGPERWSPWLAGFAAALVVLGPALAGGSLLNLDLVVTPEERLPRGLWGLGPELARRVPLAILTAPLAALVGAPFVAKAVVALSVAGATAGAARLCRDVPLATRLGAGLLYGCGPFVLTRVGVGHLPLVVAMAVLPWALPHLLHPRRSPPHTFLWLVAMSLGGVFGGLLAGVCVAVGVAADRGRGAAAAAGMVALSQLSWLLPGMVVLSQDVVPAGPDTFRTDAGGIVEGLATLAGAGFWDRTNQIGGPLALTAGLGLVLTLLGFVAHRRDKMPPDGPAPHPVLQRATVLGAVGLALAVGPALPGVRALADAAVSLPGGAALRESHRMLPLWLVVWAPAAAAGAVALSRDLAGRGRAGLGGAAALLPLAAALVLAAPGALGLGGRLDPVRFPADWQAVKAELTPAAGTVLALPWHQYLDLQIAQGRRVHNPLPDYLGGDVLISSDPEVGAPARERSDGREGEILVLLDDLAAAGSTVAPELAELGIRWVVVLADADGGRYRGLSRAPGLAHVVSGDTIDLFEVRAWRGPFVTDGGEALPVDTTAAPLAHLEASGAGTWFRPGAPGWMRGTEAATVTDDGLLRLPAGAGPVWYWPAVVVLAGHASVVAAAIVAARRARAAAPPAHLRHDTTRRRC